MSTLQPETDRERVVHESEVSHRADEVVVADEYVDPSAPVGPIARILAIAAAALFAIVGLVACAQIDWSGEPGGFDAPSVDVIGLTIAPITAVAMALLGILAIGASVGRAGDGRVVMGAILASVGVAMLIAGTRPEELELTDRLGWFTIGIGAALVLAGLASSGRLAVRRTVQRDRIDV